MKRFAVAASLLVTLAAFTAIRPLGFAARGIPLTCNWNDPVPPYSGTGVYGDVSGEYEHGTGGVSCYFGVNARDVDMVTYNSGRTLHFVFDGSDPDVQGAAFPTATFDAEVDLFGINYFGRFTDMAVGTTAQVQMDLEFHVPEGPKPRTFELDYSSLAAKRLDNNTWLITSESAPVDNGQTVFSRTAKLNEIRRRGSVPYGEVEMPIQFTVTILDGGAGGGPKGPKNR